MAHKLKLCDDFVLLQDPVTSLKTLGGILDLFAQRSGYKLNASKSTLLGLNITLEIRNEVMALTTATWSACVKYLGLRLPVLMDPATLIDLT